MTISSPAIATVAAADAQSPSTWIVFFPFQAARMEWIAAPAKTSPPGEFMWIASSSTPSFSNASRASATCFGLMPQPQKSSLEITS